MSQSPSNRQTILFMVVLSLVCATILSLLASVLAQPQETARNLYRSKQMLVAARMLNLDTGEFQVEQEGKYVPAHMDTSGVLVPGSSGKPANEKDILSTYKSRFRPLLVDDKGNKHTFEELKINEETYIAEHRKTGYGKLPYKLLFAIMPHAKEGTVGEPMGYVIPINGLGLWNVIYGYLALAANGNDVIGVSWYEHSETPGLGAGIAESWWQALFPHKQVFQSTGSGVLDPKVAELGLVVVKGKVNEVYGDSPKAKSAVDGMAGATLTGNGVTDAYRDVLNTYRPFLIKLYEASTSQKTAVSLRGGNYGRD